MLKLFGTASIEASGGPVPGRAAQGRRLALLALLALARGRPITRDKLTALLWPESPTDRARHQLSDALYIVRAALGEDVVRSAGDELVLNPDAIESDAGTFERLLDEGRLEPAVELFAGPLLDGFHLSDAAEFERWLDAEGARLGQRYAAALASLAEASEGHDQFAAAVGWWRRLAAHDPYNGRVVLRLMRALEATGDRAGALQHARVHAALLREEFDTGPDPEVTAFAERLRLEPPARSAPEPAAIRPARSPPHRDAAPAASGGAPAAGKWPAWGYAAAAIVAVTLLGVAIGLPRIARLRGGGPPVAAAVPGVAVLPFRTVGANPELWHEGIVDMLSYNLDGVGQLRKIDPVTVLTGWRRMGGSASKELSADDAREVGRRLGGRYVVTGSAVQIGADVQLIAEVQDVESGEMRGAVRVTQPADSASSLVDELTLELLRRNLLATDGEYPLPSLSRVTTTSLPALKAYLAGEREYRTAQWSDAVRHYHRAIEADSNFASAWFRLSSACWWGGGCSDKLAEDYGRRALDLADQLPDRDAKLIRANSTGDVEALEALTATYPDDVEAWVNLGDTYYHHGGVILRSTEAYRGAFTRAVRLHPYYGEAYAHLIEDAFLRLDSLDAQRLINGYVALGGHHACSYQMSYDLVWGTAAARERAMAVLDTVALNECLQAPLAAPQHALERMAQIYAAAADTATQADDRTVALWRLLQVRVPTGQITAARRALARMAGVPVTGNHAARWEIMLHLSGFPDSAAARRAARVIAAEGGPTEHFWVGALAIDEGRWTDVEAIRRALEGQASGFDAEASRPRDDIRAYSAAYAAALGAYAGLVRGARSRLAEFESALARLPALVPIGGTGWINEQPQQHLRYRVGKLLFDDGRTSDAERYFRSFQPYDYFYTTQAELYLGRIAEARGRPEEAVTHYGRFVRWWRYADEPLRPQWEEARQALSRLSGE